MDIYNRFVSKYEFILYYFLSFNFLIEFINGMTVSATNNSKFSFGMIMRGVLLLLFFFIIIKYEFQKSLKLAFIIFMFCINIILSYYLNHFSIIGVIFDIKVLIKVIFPLACILALISLYRNKLFRLNTLKSIIYNNLYSVIGLYILSYFLQIGKSTYGDAGFKSSFNGINTLTASLIVMFVFSIESLYSNRKKVISLLLIASILIILILTGTKSSILFSIFILIIYSIYDFKGIKIKFNEIITKFKKMEKKLPLILTIIIVVILIKFAFSMLFTNQIQSILDRQKHFINMNPNTPITYLLSGRDKFFVNEFDNFKNDFSIRRVVIGVGNYYEQLELGRNSGIYEFKGIEMDLFDIFFSYGLFGVITTYFWMIYMWIKNKNKLIKIEQRPYSVSFICLIIFSILGGHVFADTLAGTFIALMVSGMYMTNKEAIK